MLFNLKTVILIVLGALITNFMIFYLCTAGGAAVRQLQSSSALPQQQQQQQQQGRRVEEESEATGSSDGFVASSKESKHDILVTSKSKNNNATAGTKENQDINIKVPYPVFVASLYKSGTTSVHKYFKCGKQRSVHNVGKYRKKIGPCMKNNIKLGLDPFQSENRRNNNNDDNNNITTCGSSTYDIFSDASHLWNNDCFDPSVYGLDSIYQHHPNATILLSIRDMDSWFDSVDRFRFARWSLLPALKNCTNLWPEQPQDHYPLTNDDIRQFYMWHIRHVRSFMKAHPTMTYVEVQLESNNTASILEDKIGIPATCWGIQNVNKRYPSSTKTTSASL